jgi:hypothetical protein
MDLNVPIGFRTCLFARGPSVTADASVVWSVDKPEIAEIVARGARCFVWGIAAGSATVTAKLGEGKTVDVPIVVGADLLDQITAEPPYEDPDGPPKPAAEEAAPPAEEEKAEQPAG